jgi:nitroimidazol reductase NimA-like FMN-containing flavoprotein (pyridoxamine 5'-phosphate oxidase superfamily)
VGRLPTVSPNLDDRERACVEQLLRTAPIAHVALVDTTAPDGLPRPYVLPMNFAYQPPSTGATATSDLTHPGAPAPEGRVFVHTGPGRKVETLTGNPRVCISVTSQESLDLGASPCDDGYLYQSVVLEGLAVLLADETARETALRIIVAKYDPAAVDKPFKAKVFAKTIVYAVEVDTIGFKERPKQR